jgi:hypothetical protein
MGNSFRCVCEAFILWWLCVTEELERFPQKTRKTLSVKSVGVGVARTNQRSARNISHLKQNSNGKMSPKRDTKAVRYDSLKRKVSKESRMIKL